MASSTTARPPTLAQSFTATGLCAVFAILLLTHHHHQQQQQQQGVVTGYDVSRDWYFGRFVIAEVIQITVM